ncbi:MAG: amidase, partial [Vulcanimicrobiaceae bacterium]
SFEDVDALGFAELVRNKHVSPTELLDAAIARVERVNPKINAIITTCYDRARTQIAAGVGNGVFAGVPYLAKDLGPAVGGVPMARGSRYFSSYTPADDDEYFVRAREAGLVVFAKTNTPEFGLVPYTEPRLFGATRNPWDLTRTPGGSSGGSAAAVAAGIVPMAHANDMGGSIRIPASCCGLVGLKPSRARMATVGGAAGDANVDLCVSRSVRDTAAMLDVIRVDSGPLYAAPSPERSYREEVGRDPGRLRIAVVRGNWLGHGVSGDATAALDDAARLCASLGHRVTEDEPRDISYDALAFATLVIFASNTAWQLGAGNPLRGKRLRAGDLEPATWAMSVIGDVLSASELTSALAEQRIAAAAFARFMQSYDVILTPTLAAAPIRLGELHLTNSETTQIEILCRLKSRPLIRAAAEKIASRLFDWLPYTPVYNLTGQPAISLPLFWNGEGLPIGTQFAARLGDEGTLLRLASQLEIARPWWNRHAPLFAN